MNKQYSSMKEKNKEKAKQVNQPSHNQRPLFSQAAMRVAKNNLKQFESQSDEGFLVRAEINRKLSSL